MSTKEIELFKEFQCAAHMGHAAAMRRLSECYRNGIGTEADEYQAAAWLREAARAGDKLALDILLPPMEQRKKNDKQETRHEIKEFGISDEKDEPESDLEQKAKAGDVKAQKELANRYEYGSVDVKRNPMQAIYWYEKAAEQGDEAALVLLANLCEHCGTQKNRVTAFNGMQRMAKKYAETMPYKICPVWYQLGRYFANGIGTTTNLEQAVFYYQKAANSGCLKEVYAGADAKWTLGFCCEKGIGVQKDEKQALSWYKYAAEGHNAQAEFDVGRCYENGVGTERDPEKALQFYYKAAEQQIPEAQYALARCYEDGIGTKPDAGRAAKWYRRAARNESADAAIVLKRL